MQVSFVVPLFNCLPVTQAMVASLQATLPPGLTHEIILVDDGSTDGTRDWLRTLSAPFRIILNEENLGYAAANNRGAKLAQGAVLAFLNNDLVLTPHWLDELLRVYRSLGADAGLVGNVQRAVRTGEIDHTGIFINERGKPQHDRVLPWWAWLPGQRRRDVVAVTGACFVVAREAWHDVGGFDERYVNGCEDVDLALRMLARRRVNSVALHSVVYHHISASPGRKLRDEENTWKLTERWRDTLAIHAARAWSLRHISQLEARDPASADAALDRDALLYALHFVRSPSTRVLSGVNAAIESELRRWSDLLG